MHARRLVLAVAFCLVACGGEDEGEAQNPDVTPDSSVTMDSIGEADAAPDHGTRPDLQAEDTESPGDSSDTGGGVDDTP